MSQIVVIESKESETTEGMFSNSVRVLPDGMDAELFVGTKAWLRTKKALEADQVLDINDKHFRLKENSNENGTFYTVDLGNF